MNRKRQIVEVVGVWCLAFAMLGFLWSITGGPMLRNYEQCGSVFLCR